MAILHGSLPLCHFVKKKQWYSVYHLVRTNRHHELFLLNACDQILLYRSWWLFNDRLVRDCIAHPDNASIASPSQKRALTLFYGTITRAALINRDAPFNQNESVIFVNALISQSPFWRPEYRLHKEYRLARGFLSQLTGTLLHEPGKLASISEALMDIFRNHFLDLWLNESIPSGFIARHFSQFTKSTSSL